MHICGLTGKHSLQHKYVILGQLCMIVMLSCFHDHMQGLNWTINVEFSGKHASIQTVVLQIFQVYIPHTIQTIKSISSEEK